MADTDKRRKNTRFDIDARGIRSAWSKFDKIYDSNMQLPNDSDAVRNNMRFYIAGLMRDIETYGFTVAGDGTTLTLSEAPASTDSVVANYIKAAV